MDAAEKGEQTRQAIKMFSSANAALAKIHEAEQAGKSDIAAGLDILRPATRLAVDCIDVRLAAADLLVTWGRSDEARQLLTLGLAGAAPASDLMISLGRRYREVGDYAAARYWLKAALHSRIPDAAIVFELAEAEQATGYPSCASDFVTASNTLPVTDAAALSMTGKRMEVLGRSDLAREAYERAFAAGLRSPDFILNFCWLLNRTRAYDRLIALPMAADSGFSPETLRFVHMFSAQARLARSSLPVKALSQAEARERQPNWLSVQATFAFLKKAVEAAKPFSWVRIGDGEARFFLDAFPISAVELPREQSSAAAAVLWDNWFGQDLNGVNRKLLISLVWQLDAAIGSADLLGVTSSSRLRDDVDHVGYLSAMEALIAERWTDDRTRFYGDALDNYEMNDIDPRLASLLSGLPFLGVISPHPELAARLQRFFAIEAVASYDIPGESRLNRDREKADRGKHFPEAFQRIMGEISVPYIGAVFIVAGGILGKIYCDRIKALGGIALDVGAIVDAWMGHNTRHPILDHAMQFELPA